MTLVNMCDLSGDLAITTIILALEAEVSFGIVHTWIIKMAEKYLMQA